MYVCSSPPLSPLWINFSDKFKFLIDMNKLVPSGSSEEADEERGRAGGGGAREGGTRLVVQILRFTGRDGETGETLMYLSVNLFFCLSE